MVLALINYLHVHWVHWLYNPMIDSMVSQGGDRYEKMSMIRGQHIYMFLWTTVIKIELVLKKSTMSKTRVLLLWWRMAASLGTFPVLPPDCHGSSWNVAAVSSTVLQKSESLEHQGTWYLSETQHLLALQPNLYAAFKWVRNLFEGGFYSRNISGSRTKDWN